MSKIFSCFLIAVLSFGLLVNEASAKRFGGGRSFGVQRSQSSLFGSRAQPAPKSMGQRANSSRWGGMLGGLLVGGLLASLFMGNGLGSGIISWLILGSLIFFLVSFLRKRMQPGFQSATNQTFRANSFNNRPAESFVNNFGSGAANDSAYPAGFDEQGFLREAKVKFIRLQVAYDQNNLQDLNEFTAPEVFAEIKMQLDERGDEPNKTEVVNVEAQLLDVSRQADSLMASVHFTGLIKENNDPVIKLDEIWHFRQFFNNPNWVVGGIQQEVIELK